MSDRRKVLIATIASLLTHLLLCLVLLVASAFKPDPKPQPVPPPPAKPIELTLITVPKPTPPPKARATPKPEPIPQPPQVAQQKPKPAPPRRIARELIDSDGLARATKPPPTAVFQSDTDLQAGSELPPEGVAPLPTQMGKERKFDQFENKNYALGKGEKPAPQPEKISPDPEPEKSEAVTAVLKPTPAPVASPTPAGSKRTEVAMRQAMPTPTPALPKPTPVPTVAPSTRVVKAAPPPATSGYQAETEKTRVRGGITKRGKAGVDAVGTPLGRYRKTIADAVGSRWYFYVNRRMDMITVGDVYLKFSVNKHGRPEEIQILSNTANDTFAGYCMQAVSEARIPPIPPELLPMLENGRMEIDYHFTIYPN